MKVVRKIIRIDEELCDGCGQCVPGCAEAALEIVNGKATLMAEKYCDGLGACLGECPTGALTLVEREVDDFDEQAVEELLRRKKQEAVAGNEKTSGCPAARLQTFTPVAPCDIANQPLFTAPSGSGSALNHWPVQIRLVPPTAPFLKGADLLVAADCVPVAHADFQARFLAGRAVMIGCPKFDDPNGYVDKFTEVFQTADIKSITLAIMEVPCCSGMKAIVREALNRCGRDIPVRETVISTRGEILRQEKW